MTKLTVQHQLVELSCWPRRGHAEQGNEAMTNTLVTSAPSVIVAALRRASHYEGSTLDDSIWGRGSKRGFLSDNENTFNCCIDRRDTWAMAQLAEAHALDVLHDAYAINDALTVAQQQSAYATYTPGLTHADPFAQIDAMIHEEFPGAIPDAKLSKLRALAQERLDLKSEIESYKRAVQELEAAASVPITDGKDPRIEGLMRRAATVATAEEYCEVYDNIATQVGFPTRADLGMAKRNYSVTITRVMSLTPQEAASLGVVDVTENQWACSLDYEELDD
jgi:hypothetical protein